MKMTTTEKIKMSNETETVTNEQEQPAGISVDDIELAHQVIDVAVKRGAFHAAEVETVGALFNRMTKFIAAVKPQPTEEVEETVTNAHKEGE